MSLGPIGRIWSWTSRVFGSIAIPNVWSFLRLPVHREQLLSEVQAMTGERKKQPQALGVPRMFFAAMVAKSLISWCVFPVLGPSSVIDTAAMVVGFGQAYLAEHLKSFSDLYLMYKTANTELKDQVDVYSGENGQLKESNSRLERSLQQLELIRANMQEMLMSGAGTAESMEEAMKKIEARTEETMEVLRSQKQSFEEQKEAFRKQEAACLASKELCVSATDACAKANRRQKIEKWMQVV